MKGVGRMSIDSVNSLRMSGLVTGLDTESIVEQMTSLTKQRINTQQQKLDLLQWKQEDYRTVISEITEFKDTYFNLLKNETNIGSSSLYGKKTATSSVDGITVTASSSASEGTINVSNIVQKATAANVQSLNPAINGIKLDFSNATDGESYTVNINLDGLTKEVTFTGGADESTTQNNFLNAINSAFNEYDVAFSMDSDSEALVVSDLSNPLLKHTFTINSTTEERTELNAIGLEEKATSNITTGKKLSELAFVEPLSGDGYSFTINGVDFNFSKDTTLYQVMSQINNSDAGVDLSFSTITNKFTLETKSTGMDATLNITQKSGNLLTAMFGTDSDGNDIIPEGPYVQSASLMADRIVGDVPESGEGFGFADGVDGDISQLINQSINVTFNGETQKISLWQYDINGNKNSFANGDSVTYQLNNSLEKAFGDDCPKFEYNDKTQTFSLITQNPNDVISVSALEGTEGSEKLLTALGFNDTNSTNAVDTSKKLSELFEGFIPGTLCFSADSSNTVTLTNDTTLQELMDAAVSDDGESLITLEDGMLQLKGINEAASDKPSLKTIFGDFYNYPGIPPVPPEDSEFTGTNAVIEITDGEDSVQLTSISNSFNVNGTTINVSGAELGATDATITTTKDTSGAFEAIKSFVEDYNTLIADLNNRVTTPRPTSDGSLSGDKYEPLTDEQREEMSDSEIEKWEEKAKEGLLYHDSTIQTFLYDLRSAMSGGSGSAIVALEDMGISISSNYEDNGKLILDESKLQAALQEDPEAIGEVFADPENGIATLVKDVLNDTVETTGSQKGSLVLLAGVKNTSTVNENTISKQLEEYAELISDLEDQYEEEYERYWSQFTQLETLTAQYNSQSEWLASQFSSY